MPSHATYSGLRVLDLSTNIAGPFAAMILGDLGADVIKIERPPFGDDTRSLPPAWHGQATVFLAVNRNKRSLVLDLKSFGGREALLKLAASADVIIESFPPGLATELALTHEHFRASNPRVTVSSISAFGPGPIGSKMPGYDALVQAVSGMMSFTGDAGGPTVRIAPSLLDLTTGMWAVIAIMAALSRREHDGGGEHLNAVLLDSAFALMCHQVQGFWATGEAPAKLGSAAPSAAPYRVYRAADGEFMLATASNAQFARLCGALELNELAQDARFRTMAGRLTARAELDAILAERLARETVETWLQRLREVGIAAGQVNDLPQALELPVTRERQLFVSSEESGWKQGLPLLRLPIDTETAASRRAPPALGEHSEEILSSLGYDTTAIARLSAHA